MLKDVLSPQWNVSKELEKKKGSTYSKLSKPEFSFGRKLKTQGLGELIASKTPDSPRFSELNDRIYEVFVAALAHARYAPTEEDFLMVAFTYTTMAYPEDKQLKALVEEILPQLFE